MAGTPMPTPRQQFFDGNGNPLANGTLRSYIAGTTTPVSIYQDVALAVPHDWPASLDAYGRITVFLDAISYKFEVRDSLGATIYSQDNIPGVPGYGSANDVSGVAGENLAARDVVCISDGTAGMGGAGTAGKWVRMNATSIALSVVPVLVGVVPSAITSGATGTVRLSGVVSGFSGLAAGSTYYAATSYGALTSARPMFGRIVGVAVSSTELLLACEPRSIQTDLYDAPFHFGGTSSIGRADTSFPVGNTGADIVPGSRIIPIIQSRLGGWGLPAGNWKLRGMLAIDNAASVVSAQLINLGTGAGYGDVLSSSSVVGEMVTAPNGISFDHATTTSVNFGVKIATNNAAHLAYGWGFELFRERF